MKIIPVILILLLTAPLRACGRGGEEEPYRPPVQDPGGIPEEPPAEDPESPSQSFTAMKITVGSAVFTATPADNAAARTFGAMLPMTLRMEELNGNEKYDYLPGSLPVSSFDPGTIRSGDLMLYGANCLVLFYKTFSTGYRYTPLGRVDDPEGLEEALGRGSVTVKFEQMNEHE